MLLVRGIMRITSKVDSKWVKEYITRMRGVDVAKLADLNKNKNDGQMLGKRSNNVDLENNKEDEDMRNSKIEEAKRRFMERKKVKR